MMTIKNAKFVTSVGSNTDYSQIGNQKQIAMVGKSNVGKSSFINGLCNHNKLARISSSPGKTRLINYFSINNDGFYLVDLPGYGFARAPKTEIEKWGELIESYLSSNRVNHIFLLLDSRHEPTQDDKQMFKWIQYYSIPYTIIATKIDKLKKSQVSVRINALHKEIGAISPAIGFSAETKQGLTEILDRIEQIVLDPYLAQPILKADGHENKK